jgi:hypothetical protein
VLSTLLTLLTLTLSPAAPDTTHCQAAARFLREDRHMVAAIDPDTIDDWRTRQKVSGCRITAAGGTDIGVQREAVRLYERLRATRWTRTPDPRDSPNEASLRFRWEQTDCLFNVTADAMLNTEAEGRVNEALVLKPGETRYQVFVMCMPAMAAVPRVPDEPSDVAPDRLLVARGRF